MSQEINEVTLTEEQIEQEATKLTDPYYFWSTIAQNIPHQLIGTLQTKGHDINEANMYDRITHFINHNPEPLQECLKVIKFDFSKVPSNYKEVILRFEKKIVGNVNN